MINKLVAYQEIDAKLRKIEVELSSSEERKKAVSAKKYLDGVEEAVAKLDIRSAELNSAYAKAIDKQQKLAEQEQEFESLIAGVEDQAEAEYLLKKAGELLSKIKALSAEANKIADEIQAIIKEYATIRQTTKNAQAQYAENGKKYNELKASRQAEKQAIESELATLKKDIPEDLMARYAKKRSDKIFPVVFEVKGDTCGACNMGLPMGELSKLASGQVIECENCRRLLYKSK